MSADSAFPMKRYAVVDGIPTFIDEGGLTKREYFAGLAMQGIRSSAMRDTSAVLHLASSKEVAIMALMDADALIKELEREKESK